MANRSRKPVSVPPPGPDSHTGPVLSAEAVEASRSLLPLFEAAWSLPPEMDFEEAVSAEVDCRMAIVEHEMRQMGLLGGSAANVAAEVLEKARGAAEERIRARIVHPDNPASRGWTPNCADLTKARLSILATYLQLQHMEPRRPHAAVCGQVAKLHRVHPAAVEHAIPEAFAWLQAAFETALTAEGEDRVFAQMRIANWRAVLRETSVLIGEVEHADA